MRLFSKFRFTARLKFRFDTAKAASAGWGSGVSLFRKTTLSGYTKNDSPEMNNSPRIFGLHSLSSFFSVNLSISQNVLQKKIDVQFCRIQSPPLALQRLEFKQKRGKPAFPFFVVFRLFWILSLVVFFDVLFQSHGH